MWPLHQTLQRAVGRCVRGDKDAAIVLDGHDAAAVTIGYVVRARLRVRPGRDEFLGGTLGSARRRPLRASGGGRGGCSGKGGQVLVPGLIKVVWVGPRRFLERDDQAGAWQSRRSLLKAQSPHQQLVEVRRSAGTCACAFTLPFNTRAAASSCAYPPAFLSLLRGVSAMGCWPRSSD